MDERLDMEVLVICMGDTPWAFEGHQKDKLKGTKKLQLNVGAQRGESPYSSSDGYLYCTLLIQIYVKETVYCDLI